ncbi:MAG: DUF2225 domain-containing protein [Clostridiaceae bacterium]
MDDGAKKIFSGLEELGFEDIDHINIYKDDAVKTEEEIESEKNVDETKKQSSLLYETTIECPVCSKPFKEKAVKKEGYRMQSKDSDFFLRFSLVNPYFYDVWICGNCGYSAMKSDFLKIRQHQRILVLKNITTKWKRKVYPDIYDIDIAIERYKLALLNSVVIDAKSSQKAYICLKTAWMYRLKSDTVHEQIFLKKALQGFNDAYTNEDFPIYQMNKFTIIYLIGELYRRTGNNDDALLWFSNLITTPGAFEKIKEKARDQKDLIMEDINKKKHAKMQNTTENDVNSTNAQNANKKSILSKFFNN